MERIAVEWHKISLQDYTDQLGEIGSSLLDLAGTNT